MSTASSGMTRRAFVSHAHADNALCDRYVAALRAHGLDVWYDRTNLQSGSVLSAEIERELQARGAFIVLLSPAAVASYWVRLEIDAFRDLAARDPSRIVLPVRIAPCEIPVLLRGLKWLDVAQRPFDEVIAEIVQTVRAPAQQEVAPIPQTPGQQSLACPRCGQLDQVRKVSSIASDHRLAAPPNPLAAVQGYDPGLVGTSTYTAVWTILLTVVSLLVVCLGLSFLLGALGIDGPRPSDQGRNQLLVLLAVLIVGWGAVCLFGVAMIRGRMRRAGRQRQKAIEQVKAQAQTRVPAWEQAMATWHQLYYCGRDDLVFVPGKPDTLVPAEHMERILSGRQGT